MWLFGVSVIITTAALVVLTAKILCYSSFESRYSVGSGARILITFFIPDEFASLLSKQLANIKFAQFSNYLTRSSVAPIMSNVITPGAQRWEKYSDLVVK